MKKVVNKEFADDQILLVQSPIEFWAYQGS